MIAGLPDTGFPSFTGGESTEQKLERLQSYLFLLLESLRYTLSNLDRENFNETGLREILEPVTLRIGNAESGITELGITAEGITSRVSSAEGGIAALGLTADGLASRVESAEGAISALAQTAAGLSLSITQSGAGTVYTLSAGGMTLSAVSVLEYYSLTGASPPVGKSGAAVVNAQGLPVLENGWYSAWQQSFAGQTVYSCASTDGGASWGLVLLKQGRNGMDGAPGEPGIPGTNGTNGVNGTDGVDGVSSYVHIKYAPNDHPSASQMSETPDAYIGICTDNSLSDPPSPESYRWSKWQGRDGDHGTPGLNGTNGQSAYVHFAYANSPDGTADFQTSWFSGAMYLGVRSDSTEADPTTPGSYTWSRIKGEPGIPGAPGSNANVTFESVNNALKGLFLAGETQLSPARICAPTILGGEFHAGTGDGYSSMQEQGFNVYDENGENKIALAYHSYVGSGGATITRPYLTLGVGSTTSAYDAGLVMKFNRGLWVGSSNVLSSTLDSPPESEGTTGIFIDFGGGGTQPIIYKYLSGFKTPLGDTVAVFG